MNSVNSVMVNIYLYFVVRLGVRVCSKSYFFVSCCFWFVRNSNSILYDKMTHFAYQIKKKKVLIRTLKLLNFKIQCHIVKNTLLHTAFFAILPTGRHVNVMEYHIYMVNGYFS